MYEVVNNFRHNGKIYSQGEKLEKCEDLNFLVGKGLLKKLDLSLKKEEEVKPKSVEKAKVKSK